MTLSNLESVDEEPNLLLFLTERNLFSLKDLLARIWQQDGLLSELNIHKETSGVLNFIQVALLQGAALKLYENLENQSANRQLLIFIAVLIVVNKMAKGEESGLIGWAIKESKTKVITDKIIDQLKYVFTEYKFTELANQAIHYVVTFKSQIFTEEFEKDIAHKINVPLEEMQTYWKKFLACVSILEIQIEDNANKFPLEKIKNENTQNNLPSKINDNIDRQLKHLLSESQHILNTLNEVLELNCSFSKRYEKTCALRISVELQCQKLKTFKKTYFSIFNNQIDQYIYQVNYQLYTCYLRIIKDDLKFFGFKRKMLLSSIQNAFHCLTKLTIYYIKQYSHPHEGLWKEIHALYGLAQKEKLEKHKLDKVDEWHNQFSTIEEIYKYCLLLGTINFSQFRHEEINQIIYATEAWVKFLTIDKNVTVDAKYVVNPSQDKPPALMPHEIKSPVVFYLNFKKIIEHLTVLIARNPLDQKTAKQFAESEVLLSKYLTENLYTHWQNEEDVAEAFKPTNTNIELSFGIAREKETPKNEDPDVIEIYDCNIIFQDGRFNQKTSPLKDIKYKATIIEENEKTIMVKWQASPPLKIQPGQFVSAYMLNNVRVGIIKSLFLSENANLFLTIRLFPKEVKLLKARLAKDAFSPNFTIFLVPENIEHNKPISIIAPQIAFKEGQEIKVMSKEMEGVLLVEKPLKVYQDYQQFAARFV